MHQEAISIITEIEKSIDTNALNYGGVCAWPLFRQRIWIHLMNEYYKSMSGPSAPSVNNDGPSFSDVSQLNTHIIGGSSSPLIHVDHQASEEAMQTSTEAPDLLFFLRPEEHRDSIGDKAYAKILDSLFDRLSQYSRLKIEWAERTAMSFKRKNPSVFLDKDRATQMAFKDPKHSIENFQLIASMLEKLSLSIAVDKASAEQQMERVFRHSRLFEIVLKKFRPKVIFLSVYYHPLGMGLVLAARRMRIPTIDVQHGRLGPIHGLYTHLTQAPVNGYEIVPNYIWCWGQQTKDDIDSALNRSCKIHSGIVGGNPWLDAWINETIQWDATSEAKSLLNRAVGKKRILVSLQTIENPLPIFVINAMASAPKNWVWWIRLHPLRSHTAAEMADQLRKHGVSEFEIDDTTNLPLFWLLRHSDHHLTSFSSTTIEALAFGLRTTVFSKMGEDTFQNYVKDGNVMCAYNSEQLIKSVASSLKLPRPIDRHPFINTSKKQAELALDLILKSNA